MQLHHLQNTPLPTLVDCMLDAFSGYCVPMPTDLSFWEKRYTAARANWALSQGISIDSKLVAFIINGVDMHNGQLTAFNTGTGVVATQRGQQFVDKMYAYALPSLQKEGVQKCMLEVIQANARAIRVYERIGFHITRSLKCYKGKLNGSVRQVRIEKTTFESIQKQYAKQANIYSWDNMDAAIIRFGTYDCYRVYTHEGTYLGCFIIEPKSGYIAQIEAENEDFAPVFSGIFHINEYIRINNVDSQSRLLISALSDFGIENIIDQYEMEMML